MNMKSSEVKKPVKRTVVEDEPSMRDIKLTDEIASMLLLRERRVLVVGDGVKSSRKEVAALCRAIDEATDHNYVAGKELVGALLETSAISGINAFNIFTETLKESNTMGFTFNAGISYTDYPYTEMNADDAKLFLRQYVAYIAQAVDRFFDTKCYKEIFMQEKVERGEDAENEYNTIHSLVLRPGTMEDAVRILQAIMASKTNLLPMDEDLMVKCLESLTADDLLLILPRRIPQKTILKVVAKIVLDKGLSLEHLDVHNAVDALRIAHALSGDYKKFKLSNRERKEILSIIDKDERANINMFTKREEYLALARHIHPNNYASKYPNAAKVFDDLYKGNREGLGFMGEYEVSRSENDPVKASKAISNIPTKFAQELNSILECCISEKQQNEVLDVFESVIGKVTKKAIYQLKTFFENRNANENNVVKYTLDRYTRPMVYDKAYHSISQKVIDRVVSIALEAFRELNSDVEPLSYYINEERFSKAKVDKIGSRIPVRDTNWLRLFVYWVGGDVDLTAAFFDNEFQYQEQVSWQSLRAGRDNDGILAVHSIDVTYAPNGGEEYIDINRAKAKEYCEEKGYRYIAIMNVVFSGPSFNSMDNTFTGMMAIENPEIGDVFKPNAVAIKSVIKSGCANLAFLYDILTDEVILVNSDVSPEGKSRCRGITFSSVASEVFNACNAIMSLEKFNLYDYFKTLVEVTGGTIVEDKKDAEVILDEDGIDIFDDELYANYF